MTPALLDRFTYESDISRTGNRAGASKAAPGNPGPEQGSERLRNPDQLHRADP